MEVYSYYYGASVEKGICVQAQSKEIDKLHLDSTLRDLASLHALESSEHSNEKLSFLLGIEGYCVLGVSYIESPNNSGYTRSAPCSLQYIVHGDEIVKRADEYSRIINFINFRKPTSTVPAVMDMFPLADSGYYYHNNSKILAALVDGLIQVALSEKDVLLIALPKGKNSEYATARYTMAEVINCIPSALRTNVRFFTGLPVMEGITNPLTGYDTAMKYGANVVFCPSEYFAQLKSHRNCIGIDMENPSGQIGFFAEYVANAPNAAEALNKVTNNATDISYAALNRAAEQVNGGNIVTIDMIREQLNKSRMDFQNLERDYARLGQEHDEIKSRLMQAERQSKKYQMLEKEYISIKQEKKELQMQLDRMGEQKNKIKDYQKIEKENGQLKQDCFNLSQRLKKAEDQRGELLYQLKTGNKVEQEHKNHILIKLLGIILLMCVVAVATFLVMKPIIEKNVIDRKGSLVTDGSQFKTTLPAEENEVPDETASEAKSEEAETLNVPASQNADKNEDPEGEADGEPSEEQSDVATIPTPETAGGELANDETNVDIEMPSVAPSQENNNGEDMGEVSAEFSDETFVTEQTVLSTQFPDAQQELSNNNEEHFDNQTDESNIGAVVTTHEPIENKIGKYGKIITKKDDTVNVRRTPNKNDDNGVKQVKKETVVWMISSTINDEKETWIRVFCKSKDGDEVVGYIRSDFIKELSEKKNNDYIKKNGIPDL